MLLQVTVRLDVKGRSMTIDPPSLLVQNNDVGVTWRFLGLPNTWIPRLDFPGGRLLGPFLSLQATPDTLTARGLHAGIGGGIEYSVSFLAVSPQGALESVPDLEAAGVLDMGLSEIVMERHPTSPNILVTIEDGKMTASPANVDLFLGDAVCWYFRGLEEHQFPVIYFTDAPQGVPDLPFGPFAALTMTDLRRFGDGRFDARILGVGNNGLFGRYCYDIVIYEQDRPEPVLSYRRDRPVLSEDPVVDNNGPVIGGNAAGNTGGG